MVDGNQKFSPCRGNRIGIPRISQKSKLGNSIGKIKALHIHIYIYTYIWGYIFIQGNVIIAAVIRPLLTSLWRYFLKCYYF